KKAEAVGLLRRSLRLASDPTELWDAAELFVQLDEAASAREVMGRLRKGGFLAAPLQYLEARLLVKEGEWVRACQKFVLASPVLAQHPGLAAVARRADLLLGQCYGEMGNPDLQLTAYRRAALADPTWVAPRQGLAAALVSLGRLEDALKE